MGAVRGVRGPGGDTVLLAEAEAGAMVPAEGPGLAPAPQPAAIAGHGHMEVPGKVLGGAIGAITKAGGEAMLGRDMMLTMEAV